MIEHREEPLEMKKKFVSIKERFSVEIQKTMQVVCDDRLKSPRKRARVDIDKVMPSAMERAEECQAKLGTKYPTIIKTMLRSNVTAGFWMNFPKSFCNLHLPNHDKSVIVVDEKGDKYKTTFLAYSILHNLEEGDVLVFQFIKPSKCKVSTVKVNQLCDVDGALGLLELSASTILSEKDIETCREAHQKSYNYVGMKTNRDNSTPILGSNKLEIRHVQNLSTILRMFLISKNPIPPMVLLMLANFKPPMLIMPFWEKLA